MKIFRILIFSVGTLSATQGICAKTLETLKTDIVKLMEGPVNDLLNPDNMTKLNLNKKDVEQVVNKNLALLSQEEIGFLQEYLYNKQQNNKVLRNFFSSLFNDIEVIYQKQDPWEKFKNTLKNCQNEKDFLNFLGVQKMDQFAVVSTFNAIEKAPDAIQSELKKLLFEQMKKFSF
ncbi:hypothetical protein [Holospora curviuscula]|uniref:Uncharacterized protein n=1 Tax=Holospora curviuscula TaxID=1082868 RepID=A0A2S5R9D3_9PROT|nr:hypothetical protein [Holospora curviuscula]PPE03910.1 hypothetical protein HCUR_00690 [Holospora curviuscula]